MNATSIHACKWNRQCVLGAIIIISNEAKNSSEKTVKSDSSTSSNVIIGCSSALINTFFNSFIDLSNKILATNKIPVTTQMLYLGGFNVLYSSIYSIINGGFKLSFTYISLIFFQAILNYIGNALINSGMERIDLSKVAPIAYTKIIFILVFIFIL